MIRRIYAAFLRMRSRHHAERAQLFGMAVLNAQQRRDFTGAAYFWERMERARSRRDLLTLRASSLTQRACIHCAPGCQYGSQCLRDL